MLGWSDDSWWANFAFDVSALATLMYLLHCAGGDDVHGDWLDWATLHIMDKPSSRYFSG